MFLLNGTTRCCLGTLPSLLAGKDKAGLRTNGLHQLDVRGSPVLDGPAEYVHYVFAKTRNCFQLLCVNSYSFVVSLDQNFVYMPFQFLCKTQ